MRTKRIRDCVDDDSTVTVEVTSSVTAQGCNVFKREYEYEEEGKTLTGTEIVLEVLSLDDQVKNTLEDLAKEVSADELTLVEDD